MSLTSSQEKVLLDATLGLGGAVPASGNHVDFFVPDTLAETEPFLTALAFSVPMVLEGPPRVTQLARFSSTCTNPCRLYRQGFSYVLVVGKFILPRSLGENRHLLAPLCSSI